MVAVIELESGGGKSRRSGAIRGGIGGRKATAAPGSSAAAGSGGGGSGEATAEEEEERSLDDGSDVAALLSMLMPSSAAPSTAALSPHPPPYPAGSGGGSGPPIAPPPGQRPFSRPDSHTAISLGASLQARPATACSKLASCRATPAASAPSSAAADAPTAFACAPVFAFADLAAPTPPAAAAAGGAATDRSFARSTCLGGGRARASSARSGQRSAQAMVNNSPFLQPLPVRGQQSPRTGGGGRKGGVSVGAGASAISGTGASGSSRRTGGGGSASGGASVAGSSVGVSEATLRARPSSPHSSHAPNESSLRAGSSFSCGLHDGGSSFRTVRSTGGDTDHGSSGGGYEPAAGLSAIRHADGNVYVWPTFSAGVW